VRELRGRRGWTAAQLGKQLAEQGVRWDRFTVAGLESGKRQNVSVVEFLALASALDVAPVHLLVPLDSEPYEVTPQRVESADDVRAWVRGEKPLPGTATERARTFYAEVSTADIQRRGHIYPLGTAYETDTARDLGERDDG
jgi:transcriptional regulator with XRE-family HTH domain